MEEECVLGDGACRDGVAVGEEGIGPLAQGALEGGEDVG